MADHRYFVIGGEYADMSFTVPAAGTELETHGPFASEREAKLVWRDLTGKTVDNAMVRYFLKAADEAGGKNYWVVGGEYANSSFTRLAAGKELEVYGPFERSEALGFWRGLAAKSVDDALVRYDIRENYEAGDAGGKLEDSGPALPATATKTVVVAIAPQRLLATLADAGKWTWAPRSTKPGRALGPNQWELETPRGKAKLTVACDQATGMFDHTVVEANGVVWSVPGRVMAVGPGAALMMLFTKPTAFTDAQFSAAMAQVDEDLAAMKRVVEAG